MVLGVSICFLALFFVLSKTRSICLHVSNDCENTRDNNGVQTKWRINGKPCIQKAVSVISTGIYGGGVCEANLYPTLISAGSFLQGPLGEIVKRRVLIGQLAPWLHFQKLWNNPEIYLFQSNIQSLLSSFMASTNSWDICICIYMWLFMVAKCSILFITEWLNVRQLRYGGLSDSHNSSPITDYFHLND